MTANNNANGSAIPWNEVKRLPLVFSVEEEEGKGKAEPNANKAQLLLRRRQGCVDHLMKHSKLNFFPN